MTIPYENIIATSLGIEGFAAHLSPGSGKYFRGRKVLVDLALVHNRHDFKFLEEGGWRNAEQNTHDALEAVQKGKRTKTALSNSALGCTPIAALRDCFLVKTGGEILQMAPLKELLAFPTHECSDELTSCQVAQAIGRPTHGASHPRLYMVLSPTQFIVLANLTPEEYAWYATHRPGKMFRQFIFTELRSEQPHHIAHIAAHSRFENARKELLTNPHKKTKTIVFEDCINRIPFSDWIGYRHEEEGGIYVADRNRVNLWQFPKTISKAWEKATG